MLIYNITCKVAHAVHQDWLQWMQEKHIPDILATGIFTNYQISRLLGQDEQDGITYAVQYTCANLAAFQKYQTEFRTALQKEHAARYGENVLAFRSLLEVVAKS